MKLSEGNIGRTFFDINHSNIFLDLYPRAKTNETSLNFKRFAQKGNPRQNEKITQRTHLQMITTDSLQNIDTPRNLISNQPSQKLGRRLKYISLKMTGGQEAHGEDA